MFITVCLCFLQSPDNKIQILSQHEILVPGQLFQPMSSFLVKPSFGGSLWTSNLSLRLLLQMRTRRVELQREKLVLYFQTYMQRTGAEDLFGLFDGVSCDVVDSESRDLKI